MKKLNIRYLLLTAVLALSGIANSACDSDNPVIARALNTPPIFQGVKRAGTMGGPLVMLSWDAASDDTTAPERILFRVYASDTSRGQNFNAPIASANGANRSVIVSVPEGQTRFFVVRAFDLDGANDGNEVEISVTTVPESARIYVDEDGAMSGSGTFSDPYATIQEGVDAAEALSGAGLVVVAAGTYNEQVRLTVGDTDPIQLLGGIPDLGDFASEPTAIQLLQAFDPMVNVAEIDGGGITQYTASNEGLIHIENDERPTSITGLRISDAEEVAIFAIDTNLVAGGNTIVDPDGGNETDSAIRLDTSNLTMRNIARITGNRSLELPSADNIIQVGGVIGMVDIGANEILQPSDGSGDGVGVGTSTEVASVSDSDAAVLPAGEASMLRIHGNRIFHTDTNGIELDFEPEDSADGGDFTLEIIGNRIEFIDGSDGIDIEDLDYVGTGGSVTFNVLNNRIVSTESAGLDLEFRSSFSSSEDAPGPITVRFEDNLCALCEGEVVDIENLPVTAGETTLLTYNRNQNIGTEGDVLEIDDFSPLNAPMDGRYELEVLNNQFGRDGSTPDQPDFEVNTPPGADGGVFVTHEDNVHFGSDGQPTVNLDFDSPLGPDQDGEPYNNVISIQRNIVSDFESTSTDFYEIDFYVANGLSRLDFKDNVVRTASSVLEVDAGFSGDVSGPDALIDVEITDNILTSEDYQILDIEMDGAATPQSAYFDISRNTMVAGESEEGMELDTYIFDGPVEIVIEGNFIQNENQESIDIDLDDQSTMGSTDASALVSITNNTIWSFDSSGQGITLDADVAGGGMTTVEILHNELNIGGDEPIDLALQSADIAAGGSIHAVIFNNTIPGHDEEFDVDVETGEQAGERTYVYISHNDLLQGEETAGFELDGDTHGILLFSNNLGVTAEVDSEEGLQLSTPDDNPGQVWIQNSTLALAAGDGLDLDSGTVAQVINNTIALNANEGGDSDGGVEASSASDFAQGFLMNNIVWDNGLYDLDSSPMLRASYSLIGDEDPPMGFGNIAGDPLFNWNGDLFEPLSIFTPLPGSPAFDMGNPAMEYNDPDGTINDLGAGGGPAAGTIGSLLPDTPDVPFVVLGVVRPVDSNPELAGQVHLWAGGVLGDFGPSDPVQVVFSQPIDETTLSAGLSFSVGGSAIAGTMELVNGGRSVEFTPNSAVSGGSIVRVAATSALRSAPATFTSENAFVQNVASLAYPWSTNFAVAPSSVMVESEAGGAVSDSNDIDATPEAVTGSPGILIIDGTAFADSEPGDAYSFSALAGERLQVTAVVDRLIGAGATTQMRLELWDSTGMTLITADDTVFANVDSTNFSDPYLDYVFPEDGTYLLRVLPAGAPVGGGPYEYEVHWFKQPL